MLKFFRQQMTLQFDWLKFFYTLCFRINITGRKTLKNNYLLWELQLLVPHCVRRNQGGSLFCQWLYSALHWQVMPLVPPGKQNCNGASLRTFQHLGMAAMKWEFCFLSGKPQGWNSPSNPELWKTQVQKPNGGVHSEKKNTAAPSVYICLSIKSAFHKWKKFDGQ